MNGLDQIIVALWLLPVVLFIIIPLSIACLNPLYAYLFGPEVAAWLDEKPITFGSWEKQTA